MPGKKKYLIDKFDSQDVIAIIIILGGFILIGLHIDTVVGGVVTMVAGFYFGSKMSKK